MHKHIPSDGGQSDSMATENPTGKVAIPALSTTAYTAKEPKKRKTDLSKRESKRESDNKRNKTRVNIGEAFQRWRDLRESLNLKLDSELAVLLLDSYEKVTSTPQGAKLLGRAKSKRTKSRTLNADRGNAEEFNDIRNSVIDWVDEETAAVSSLVEETGEADSDDSDVCDYDPPFCVRTGGALHNSVRLDALTAISMEDTVHDSSDLDPVHTGAPHTPENLQPLSEEEVISQPASIAYHLNLKLLAEFLVLPVPKCTAKDPITFAECQAPGPFQVKVKSRATAAIIEWVCPRDHIVWHWSSQSSLKGGMQVGDFMLAVNILLSGSNYAKVALLLKFMNMGMVGKSAFCEIQDTHCLDNIKQFWEKKRGVIISQLKSKPKLVVLGDGWMDNPGFSAQYCTYSVMENDSKEIISVVTVEKQEKEQNKAAMEKEACIRTFDVLRQDMRNLREICTDAHSQIMELFTEGIYKSWGVRHTLDMWHGLKNLGKKIHKAGQKKECSILHRWSKDVCNHFWYCAKMAENSGSFLDLWTGILNYVTGEHNCSRGPCRHGPMSDNVDKEWMQKGSVAYEVFSEIVLNEHWLEEVHKYLGFRSTAELESFHNHILMYVGKRFSFSRPVYAARTLLAVLDYNHHVNRPVLRKADGSVEYRKLFNRKSRKWTLYTVKVNKDYGYIPDLQRAILQSFDTSGSSMPPVASRRPDDPQQLVGLCGIPPPAREGLLLAQVTQGQDVQLLLVCRAADPPVQQQQWNPSVDQQNPPELPHIKEEQQEEQHWSSQEGEQPQGLEEADVKVTLSPVPVKSEEEEKPLSSQLHQIQTEDMKTEPDGVDIGGPEPSRNSDQEPQLQPDTDQNTSHFYEHETDDSDEWEKNSEPETGSDSPKNNSGCKTGEKSLSCSKCGKRVSQKNLETHMRTHSGEKPFNCSVCGERFVQKIHLTNHMTLHTGEKPFTCSVCGRGYVRSALFKKHKCVGHQSS